uniref:RNA helicase n=1 Tax=Panagrellus redivivus TaxID=6233 RepID=A0A7E4VU60_PANRE
MSDGRIVFKKPSEDIDTVTSAVLEEREDAGAVDDAAISQNVVHNPYLTMSIQKQRNMLPISKHKNQVLYALQKYRTVVIVGETGCGKSTQVPQFLMEAGWCADKRVIGITQPRRVAAVTLATRVADEQLCRLGSKVGFVVRFGGVTSDDTVIQYMTDGILLREMSADPLLLKYSVIMVDEAHERSVNTDLLLALLRRLQKVRYDLRVIVSSATLDAAYFRQFFELNETSDESKNTAVILSVEGSTYPVEIFYVEQPVPDYIKAAMTTVLRIHTKESSGDILVFLTGMDEVEAFCKELIEYSKKLQNVDRLWVVPMYSGLTQREQLRAFDSTPFGQRKVVVATNIAETSVTIPGIAYVVDCGFVKMRIADPANGIESLMLVPVSQAAADQRAGRAGRLRAGKCFRMYPEAEYKKLLTATVPEIQRCHLAPVILQLKTLGVANVVKFHYLARPRVKALATGFDLLHALGAVDNEGALTNPLGLKMCTLPLPPMHAKVLLSSEQFGCSEEILTILAMMQIQEPFDIPKNARHNAELTKREFSVAEGDHLTLLNVYHSFIKNNKSQKWCNQVHVNFKGLCRAENIRQQLKAYLKKNGMKMVSCKGLIGETERVRRCLLCGFFTNVARYGHDGRFHTIYETTSYAVYKGSAMMYRDKMPKWVVFTDVLQNSIRDISEIDPDWIQEVAPNFYDFGTNREVAAARGADRTREYESLADLN